MPVSGSWREIEKTSAMRVPMKPEKPSTVKRESTHQTITIQSNGVCVGDDHQLLIDSDGEEGMDTDDQVHMAIELRIPKVDHHDNQLTED